MLPGERRRTCARVVVVDGSSSSVRISARVAPSRRDAAFPHATGPWPTRAAVPRAGYTMTGGSSVTATRGATNADGERRSPLASSSTFAAVCCRIWSLVPVQRHDGRQIFEQPRDPSFRQAPRAVGDISFEELSHHRPRGLDQHPPGRVERVGYASSRARGAKRAQSVVVDMPPVERSLDLCARRSRRRLSDPLQLLVDIGEMRGRRSNEKIGYVPWIREECEKQPEIVIAMESLHDVASLSEPPEVGRVADGAGDRAGSPHNLAQRRDGEAAVEHGVDGEDERDRGPRIGCDSDADSRWARPTQH